MKLTNKTKIVTIDNVTTIYTFTLRKKYVCIIDTPYYTKVLKYKNCEDCLCDMFDRIKILGRKATCEFTEHGENLMLYYYKLKNG